MLRGEESETLLPALLVGDCGLRCADEGRFDATRPAEPESVALAPLLVPSVHSRMSVTLQSLHSGLH